MIQKENQKLLDSVGDIIHISPMITDAQMLKVANLI